MRTDTIGSDIGICLRTSGYSPVSHTAQAALARTLQASAQDFQAGLVPVLISDYRSEDRRSTLPLLHGSRAARRPLGRFARPQDVARQVGTCRVLVTGAYHAAVFALTQGIPVIALSTSRYYEDKFLGLADMFGTGLELVDTETEDLQEPPLDGGTRGLGAGSRGPTGATDRCRAPGCREPAWFRASPRPRLR